MHSCPIFFTRCMWAMVRLIALFPKAPRIHILYGRALILLEHRQAAAIALESDLYALPPVTPCRVAVFSPSGLELYTGHEGHVNGHVCRGVMRLVLQTMADSTRNLTALLMVLTTLEFPLRVSPSLNPQIHTQHPHIVLPLSAAVVARWATYHLQAWVMVSNGLLPLPMPPPPRSRWAPLVSIHIMPRHSLPHEQEFLRAVVGPVVLLTRPSQFGAPWGATSTPWTFDTMCSCGTLLWSTYFHCTCISIDAATPLCFVSCSGRELAGLLLHCHTCTPTSVGRPPGHI